MERSQKGTARATLWIAGVAVAALAVAGVIGLITGAYHPASAAGRGIEINETRSIPAKGVERLAIGTTAEAIRLVESKDGSFQLHFSGRVLTSDESALPVLAASVSGGELGVEIREPARLLRGYAREGLLLEVAVPKGFAGAVSLQSVAGKIEALGHSYARFAARTTSGGITADSVAAPSVALHSVSGAVSARNLDAKAVSIGTTSGSVSLQSSAGVLELHTVSGAVTASSSAQPERFEVGSTSGSVTLRLPAGAGFRLDARSTSGAVRCDFPITIEGSRTGARHELIGSVAQASGASVRVRTISGSISVMKSL